MIKKIFIKVSLKTVAVVLSIIVAIFSLTTIFYPTHLAKLTKDMGLVNASASFKIIEYNRNKNINDLADVLELSIWGGNDSRILKYANLLVNHSKFNDFCTFKDNNNQNSLIIGGYEHYIYGFYNATLYNRGEVDKAIEQSKRLVSFKNYPENNVMQYLIMSVAKKNDTATSSIIAIYLNELKHDNLDESIVSRINNHIKILNDIIEG